MGEDQWLEEVYELLTHLSDAEDPECPDDEDVCAGCGRQACDGDC